MSRVRRLALSGHIFFITCDLLLTRTPLTERDFEILADAIRKVRARRALVLAGYVFMPDHWHALLVPGRRYSIDRVMNAIKVSSAHAINRRRGARGRLWHSRYYDRVVRTVKEFHDTLRYMHVNPVTAGLVKEPGEWL